MLLFNVVFWVFLDRLSSGGSLLFQLGVSVLGGNTRPSSRVHVLGGPWVLSCSLESLGCAHSPLWYLKALGDRMQSSVGVAVLG